MCRCPNYPLVSELPLFTVSSECVSHARNPSVPNWRRANNEDVIDYKNVLDNCVRNMNIPNALSCNGLNCDISSHNDEIEDICHDLISVINQSAKVFE